MKQITNEMIWQKLLNIEKMLRGKSVEEISVNRACKLLHMGYETLIEKITSGKIKARPVSSKKAKNGITYKLKISEIESYQEKPDIDLKPVKFETPEEIINNFHKNSTK